MRRLIAGMAPALDMVMAPLAWLAAHQMLLVRKLTPGRAPRCMRALDRVGIYPLIDHYYDPMIDLRHLRHPLTSPRPLAGLELDGPAGLTMLQSLHAMQEFRFAPAQAGQPAQYYLDNSMFGPLDASVYYGLIRQVRPRRIVEVGAGMSTLAAQHAIARNRAEHPAYQCDHVCIEPYEQPWLDNLPIRLIRTPMERCSTEAIDALDSDDILFIDSSHMVRPQGDVLTAILEWLGRLEPGVLVHFHDIYTPRDYPIALLRDHRFFWNEQYVLEAFLAFNDHFRVLMALNDLSHRFPEQVQALCPAQTPARVVPASFWLRRTA